MTFADALIGALVFVIMLTAATPALLFLLDRRRP